MISVSGEESSGLDSYMDGLIDLDLFDFEEPDGQLDSGEEQEGGENKLRVDDFPLHTGLTSCS